MNLPRDSHHLPRHLASAIAWAIAAGFAAPAHCATAADDWIRFRADRSERVFADMADARSRPLPSTRVAATWPVTNCADAGAGSLRDAIGSAASGDAIDLTALTCGTITLQTGAIPINLDDLTVTGPGRNALTIDGNDADRVFFHPGHGQLTLAAMTVQRGRDRATGFHIAGGGCIASAGYLTLDNATVRNCYAGGEGAYGGAIYAYSLAMTNSTLSGNRGYGVHEDAGTAAFGGAAFVYTMQLVDSTLTGNRAEHLFNPGRTSYDIGGGIITIRGGSIENSTIDSNFSYGRGGGIAAFNPIAVSNSTFSGNIAQTEIGGALFLRWPATLEANNSTITANHAQAGGGGVWLPASDPTCKAISCSATAPAPAPSPTWKVVRPFPSMARATWSASPTPRSRCLPTHSMPIHCSAHSRTTAAPRAPTRCLPAARRSTPAPTPQTFRSTSAEHHSRASPAPPPTSARTSSRHCRRRS